jgi:hypothetical protein
MGSGSRMIMLFLKQWHRTHHTSSLQYDQPLHSTLLRAISRMGEYSSLIVPVILRDVIDGHSVLLCSEA